MTTNVPVIRGFHAHIYFGPETIDQARNLCEQAAKEFPLKMGRVHEKAVGPHPDWSCQLAFKPELFGQLIQNMTANCGAFSGGLKNQFDSSTPKQAF